jgi:hypothetical protein
VARKRVGKVPEWLRPEIQLRVHPQHWLAKARELKKAADLLFEKFDEERIKYDEEFEKDHDFTLPSPDDSVVNMLLGFAVENLLKGIYVSTLKNAEQIKDLSELNIPTRGHELEPIANAVALKLRIDFSQDEIGLLQALEHVILWYGRYPSARNIDDLIPAYETGYFRKFTFDYPKDHFATLKLYDRLETILFDRAGAPTWAAHAR